MQIAAPYAGSIKLYFSATRLMILQQLNTIHIRWRRAQPWTAYTVNFSPICYGYCSVLYMYTVI